MLLILFRVNACHVTKKFGENFTIFFGYNFFSWFGFHCQVVPLVRRSRQRLPIETGSLWLEPERFVVFRVGHSKVILIYNIYVYYW